MAKKNKHVVEEKSGSHESVEPEINMDEMIEEIVDEIHDEPFEEIPIQISSIFQDERKKIGIMVNKFVLSNEYSPGSPYKHFKSYQLGQVIFNRDEIEQLLSIGAPIKVYIEDGSN